MMTESKEAQESTRDLRLVVPDTYTITPSRVAALCSALIQKTMFIQALNIE